MKEELQKEVISTVKEEIAEIKSSLKERMKLPILVAYCIILVIYNWDVLFYFVLESGTATTKIDHIKTTFTNVWYHRYLCPLAFALISTFTFPALQVLINLLFKKIKNANDEIVRENEEANTKHEKKLIDLKSSNKEKEILQEDLNNKKDEILVLKSQINHLEKSNLDLVQSEIELNNSVNAESEKASDNKKTIRIFKELFLTMTDYNYVSRILNYPNHFKSFYNYFASLQIDEKEFVRNFLSKFTEKHQIADLLDMHNISVPSSVDKDKILSYLLEIGILETDTIIMSWKLSHEGKEVKKFFAVIEENYNSKIVTSTINKIA